MSSLSGVRKGGLLQYSPYDGVVETISPATSQKSLAVGSWESDEQAMTVEKGVAVPSITTSGLGSEQDVIVDAWVAQESGVEQTFFESPEQMKDEHMDAHRDGSFDVKQLEHNPEMSETTRLYEVEDRSKRKMYLLGGICAALLAFLGIGVGVAVSRSDAFVPANNVTETNQTCVAPRCISNFDCQTSENSSISLSGRCYSRALRCSNAEYLMEDYCPCFSNSDCASQRCDGVAPFKSCAPLLPDGFYCNEGSDCISGRCDKPVPSEPAVCIQRENSTEGFCGKCNENSDCESNSCHLLTQQCNSFNGKLSNDCFCLSKSDCDSGRCDFVSNNPFDGKKCRAKAGDCEGCNENSDCESNDCYTSVFRCRNPQGTMSDGCNCLRNRDCMSNRCDAVSRNPVDGFFCKALGETCDPCNENTDCASSICFELLGRCANAEGKMDDGCDCFRGADCISGRCERQGTVSLCASRLENGSPCNEGSDCLSGRCDKESYNLLETDDVVCMDKVASCEACNENSDCISNSCNIRLGGRCALTEEGKMGEGCICTLPSDCHSGRCLFVCLSDSV